MMPTGAVAVCRPVAVRTWYTGRFPFDPGSVECHDLERNTLVDDDAPHEEFNRLGHAQTIPHNTRSLAALTSGVTRIWIVALLMSRLMYSKYTTRFAHHQVAR